jgi:hypothetical protein
MSKLSFVMCTNRTGLATIARITRLASIASDKIEIVVRDNSQDGQKMDFLERLQGSNRQIVFSPPCGGWENQLQAMALATGDYIFEVGDDDDVNVLAVADLLDAVERLDPDPSYVGVTGNYVLETDRRSVLYGFERLAEPAMTDRVAAFLKGCPSVLHFSAIRRQVRSAIDDYLRSMPYNFSYVDLIQSVLLLCIGRFHSIDRIIYSYDMHNWSDRHSAQQADLRTYRENDVDVSGLRLHGLLQAFEGAKTIAAKFGPLPLSAEQRLDIARTWFVNKFAWFVNSPERVEPGARFDAQASAIATKWKHVPEVNFEELLFDLSGFFALSSPEAGQRYYDFWK